MGRHFLPWTLGRRFGAAVAWDGMHWRWKQGLTFGATRRTIYKSERLARVWVGKSIAGVGRFIRYPGILHSPYFHRAVCSTGRSTRFQRPVEQRARSETARCSQSYELVELPLATTTRYDRSCAEPSYLKVPSGAASQARTALHFSCTPTPNIPSRPRVSHLLPKHVSTG